MSHVWLCLSLAVTHCHPETVTAKGQGSMLGEPHTRSSSMARVWIICRSSQVGEWVESGVAEKGLLSVQGAAPGMVSSRGPKSLHAMYVSHQRHWIAHDMLVCCLLHEHT